jgi:hypothetical protein
MPRVGGATVPKAWADVVDIKPESRCLFRQPWLQESPMSIFLQTAVVNEEIISDCLQLLRFNV